MAVHVSNVEAYFQYHPSLAPNILALILFLLVTLVISVQNVKHRSPYMWIVSFTGGLEVGGYISRLVAARTVDLNAYITQLVLTILAPNFLALANYMTVGKVAEHLKLSGRFLNTKTIAGVFFAIDIITIAVQGAGSAIVSSTLQTKGSASESGETIILVGLAVQLAFFALFILVTLYVYRCQGKMPPTAAAPKQVYICLLLTIILITIRNIFRVAETAMKWTGYLMVHEVFFYCLDALPIFLAFCVYSALHFGKYLNIAREPVLVHATSRKTKAQMGPHPAGTSSSGTVLQADSSRLV